MNPKRLVIQIVLVLVLLGAGGGIANFLIMTRKQPPKAVYEYTGPMVNVAQVHTEDVQMIVEGFGTVQARAQVQVIPEVAGRIVYMHPNLVAGGFFKADEPLIRIDPRDYELALETALASLAGAQVVLEQERAEADVARTEWEILNPGKKPTSSLVLRDPQIREAVARLDAAKAQVEEAKLDLDRTTVSLPYAGRVINKSVDLGQYVQPGVAVAEIYGTQVMEIPIPLQQQELAWFGLPDTEGRGGAQVDVQYTFAGTAHHRSGRIVRSNAQIDHHSRMVHVIVEVEDPFDGTAADLVPGTFVTAAIQGLELSNVTAIPSYALRDGIEVWIVQDKQLRIKPVTLARRTKDTAYIADGLPDSAQVVLTSLEVVSDGMKVRTPEETLEEQPGKKSDTVAVSDAYDSSSGR